VNGFERDGRDIDRATLVDAAARPVDIHVPHDDPGDERRPVTEGAIHS
jgi:hypothetical protein